MSVIEKKPRQPNVLFMNCLFSLQLQCYAGVGWHPTSVMKPQCRVMTLYYVSSIEANIFLISSRTAD